MGVPGNVKQSKEELVISSPYIGKHVYMMNRVQATILPGAVVLVLFLRHPHLYGTQGCAHTVPQPQDPYGRGPFPAHKGSTKLLLRVQSHVVVLGEEHGVCSAQPGLRCELTVLIKGQLCQSCELKCWILCSDSSSQIQHLHFGNLRLLACSNGWRLWKGSWRSPLPFLIINILKRQLVRKVNESKFISLVISRLHKSSVASTE